MDMMDKKLFEKLQAGRKKYQDERTKRRLAKESDLLKEGILEVGKLSNRDIFVAGIALYWAEGFKHKDESGLGLATMDPRMAKFYIHWLENVGIQRSDLLFRVTANQDYRHAIDQMESWWADGLGVDIGQFAKPFFQRVKQVKIYANSSEYHGVLRIRARRSLDLLRKMRGWMAGMATKW